MDCVNLQEQYGDRLKVDYEESYKAAYGPNAWREDPWLMIIPCENGHFYPFDGEMLAFASDKNGPIANTLRELDFVTIHQDGSDGVNIVFPVERFEDVAEIVKPKKRRKPMSEEQRQASVERLRQYQYQPKKGEGVQDVVEKRRKSA